VKRPFHKVLNTDSFSLACCRTEEEMELVSDFTGVTCFDSNEMTWRTTCMCRKVSEHYDFSIWLICVWFCAIVQRRIKGLSTICAGRIGLASLFVPQPELMLQHHKQQKKKSVFLEPGFKKEPNSEFPGIHLALCGPLPSNLIALHYAWV